jgi:hypothetical protein
MGVKRERPSIDYASIDLCTHILERDTQRTMIRSASGVFSGMSITLPAGPVRETFSPGLESQR